MMLGIIAFLLALAGLSGGQPWAPYGFPCAIPNCASHCIPNATENGIPCGNSFDWNCLCYSEPFLGYFEWCAHYNCPPIGYSAAYCEVAKSCSSVGAPMTFGPYSTAVTTDDPRTYPTFGSFTTLPNTHTALAVRMPMSEPAGPDASQSVASTISTSSITISTATVTLSDGQGVFTFSGSGVVAVSAASEEPAPSTLPIDSNASASPQKSMLPADSTASPASAEPSGAASTAESSASATPSEYAPSANSTAPPISAGPVPAAAVDDSSASLAASESMPPANSTDAPAPEESMPPANSTTSPAPEETMPPASSTACSAPTLSKTPHIHSSSSHSKTWAGITMEPEHSLTTTAAQATVTKLEPTTVTATAGGVADAELVHAVALGALIVVGVFMVGL